MLKTITCEGVDEYEQGFPVSLGATADGSLILYAGGELAEQGVEINLSQLLTWLQNNFTVEVATKLFEAARVTPRTV